MPPIIPNLSNVWVGAPPSTTQLSIVEFATGVDFDGRATKRRQALCYHLANGGLVESTDSRGAR